jgi:hypothetical protein
MQRYNRAFKIQDGVLHLNPAFFESPKPRVVKDKSTYRRWEQKDLNMHIIGVILAQQFSVKKGIELFGDEGRKAVSKELQQMHDMVAYTPVDASTMTREQKLKALESLMFLVKKRCGRIKARACANGSKQRVYIRKEDAASPTIGTDIVFITGSIEAHEGREVVTVDIPGAFLHTDTDEHIHMLLRRELAELMVRIDPSTVHHKEFEGRIDSLC